MIYCQDSTQTNTEGQSFAKAIQQLTTGVYIGEICLIGLFSISTAGKTQAAGPLALMIVFLILTAIFHTLLNWTLISLEKNVSHEMDTEMMPPTNGDSKDETVTTEARLPSASVNNKPTNFLVKMLLVPPLPVFDPYLMTRGEDYTAEIRREAYLNPSIWKPTPKLWIVHDQMGISTREIAETSKVIEISDVGAWFDEKGKVTTILSEATDKDDANLAKEAYVWEEPVQY